MINSNKFSKIIKKGVSVTVITGQNKNTIGEVIFVDRKNQKVKLKGMFLRQRFIKKFIPQEKTFKKIRLMQEGAIDWSNVKINEIKEQ